MTFVQKLKCAVQIRYDHSQNSPENESKASPKSANYSIVEGVSVIALTRQSVASLWACGI